MLLLADRIAGDRIMTLGSRVRRLLIGKIRAEISAAARALLSLNSRKPLSSAINATIAAALIFGAIRHLLEKMMPDITELSPEKPTTAGV